jgi:PilZ domain-containing protein
LESSSKYFPIRRSTRLPLEIPLRVTSLDPKVEFAENGTTVTVSAHGCGIVSPRPIAAGTRVQLEIVADQRTATARALEVVPLDDTNTSFLLGIEMEHAGNFWGIKYAPADWAEEDAAPAPQPREAPPSPPPQEPSAAVVPAAAHVAPPVGVAIHRAKSARAASAKAAAAPAKAAPKPTAPAPPPPTKEISESVLRRLLAECRLAAISQGACYLQTGKTFPLHAPVKVTVRAGSDHSFHGSVRIEHVGAGMGIEFSGSGEEHNQRITALIEALAGHGDKVPETRVELAAPDKSHTARPKASAMAAAQSDSLLALILTGGSLKRSDFLRELENQRLGN